MEYNLEVIKEDVRVLSERDFLIKYLLESESWYFSCLQKKDGISQMEKMKEILSRHLGIAYNSILMVGSGKIGVSLSPGKFPKQFNDDSDIDIAIVSNKLFSGIWDQLRKDTVQYNKLICKSIFRGFINEKQFNEYTHARQYWTSTIKEANVEIVDKLAVYNQVNYRIYRSWEDLEEYHSKGITRIKGLI